MSNIILHFAIDLTKKICERAENGEIRDLDIMAEAVLSEIGRAHA